jgi:hypothetical protein
MPSHILVNKLGLTYKSTIGISMATLPDVCKTPSPGGPVPVPYPNYADQSTLANGTKTVKAKGGKMIAIKGSEYSMSTGDEPGTVGGVKSSTFKKETAWITYSFDVKMDGKNACRHTDKKFHNHKNTVNLAGNGEPALPAEPLREPKPESLERDKERGFDHEKKTHNGKDVGWALLDKPPKNRELIYVKKPDGSFVFSPRPKQDLNQRRGLTLPHSMLAGGGKVIGAGECQSDADGKISQADNFSGHYQPKEEHLEATKKNMEGQGLSAAKPKFEVKNAAGEVTKVL